MSEKDPLSEAASSINSQHVDKSEAYSDLDKMPFGTYKGTILQEVPCSYLHYLWCRRPLSDHKLEAYIKWALPGLKKENPDLIW